MGIESNQSSNESAKAIEATGLVQVKLSEECKHFKNPIIRRARILTRIALICILFIVVIIIMTRTSRGRLYDIKLCIQKIFCGHNSEGFIVGGTCFGIEIVKRSHSETCDGGEIAIELRPTRNNNYTIPSVCLSDNNLIVLDKYQNTRCDEFLFYSHNFIASSTQTTLCFAFDDRYDISYLDDVSVMNIASNNRNLLLNGGFEKTPDRNAWQTDNDIILISTFARPGGHYSFSHNQYYNYHHHVWQTFPTLPGHTYNISLYFVSGNSDTRRLSTKVLVGS